jgi:hypothetical protein
LARRQRPGSALEGPPGRTTGHASLDMRIKVGAEAPAAHRVAKRGEAGGYLPKSFPGRYDPGMTDGRLPASLTSLSRALRWKPRTYRQAWLFAAFCIALPSLAIFSIFGIRNGWHQPWPALVIEFPAIMLVSQGLGLSYDVHRRRQRDRRMSTLD